MQGGASGSGDEAQPGAPGDKAGAHAKAGAKGTVGAPLAERLRAPPVRLAIPRPGANATS